MGALDGIRILDLTRGIAGPMGVMLLAEHGADVIKIEPPGGEPNRDSPEHRVWNRGRRSIELDLATDEGKEQFLALTATADVLVESFRPGAMAKLGLDYDTVAARNPRLVYASVPGYPAASRHAGRPGWDALVQARAGLQWEQPGWRAGPIFLQNSVPSMAAAYLVPAGIVAALSAREETGRGQHVETSLLQGVMALTTMLWIHAERGQDELSGTMSKTYPPGIHQWSVYECADGWIHASGGAPTGGKTMNEIIGLPPEIIPQMVMMHAMQGTPEGMAQAIELSQTVEAAFKRHKVADLLEEFHANGLGAEAITPMGEFLDHPQLLATNAVVELDDPEVGRTTQLGVTINLVDTPGAVRGPRPLPGQHTAEVLAELASAPAAHASPAPASSKQAHALGDIRVLDFGRAFAGPFACMVLGSMGADVIKVEAPGAMSMGGGPQLGCQAGKRAIAVDMKRPEGRQIVDELIARTDVVHHNMTKGVAERLGIDQATLRKIKPDIVSCNTFMYGPTGPLSDLGGLDPLAQAAAGLEYEAGPVAEGNRPLWYRFGHGDTANALASIVGTLMAVYHRKRTGQGQAVWTSLLHGTALWGSGAHRTPDGMVELAKFDKAQTGLSATYRLFPTADGWLQVAAVKPEHWPALCAAVGRAELADDARFATAEARRDNRSALDAELEPIFRTRTALQWRRRLDAGGVPSEISMPTIDGDTMLFDQENIDLGLVVEYEHPVHGALRQVNQLITFSDTPGRVERPPALPGEHTVEIMRWLGYDDETIALFRKDGIIDFPEGALDV